MADRNSPADGTLNPNSALYWLPATRDVAANYAEVHVPQTEIIRFDFMESLGVLEGERPEALPYSKLEAAARDLGWPAFLRTDLSSAKDEGMSAIRVTGPDSVPGVVSRLMHDTAEKTMRPAAFLVREWIDIESTFEAFGGLPIGVEFRVTATPDRHLCTHYYWPQEKIRKASVPANVVESRQSDLAAAPRPPWLGAAAQTAAAAANARGGVDDPQRAWSVDFARDETGDWWLIDMALATDAWHPECDTDLQPTQIENPQ